MNHSRLIDSLKLGGGTPDSIFILMRSLQTLDGENSHETGYSCDGYLILRKMLCKSSETNLDTFSWLGGSLPSDCANHKVVTPCF